MQVRVKLYATLREYAPSGTDIGEIFNVNLSDETVQDLINHLGIKTDQAKIVIINDNRIFDYNYQLQDGDLVVIFPPIGGG